MAKNDYSRRSKKDVFWGDDDNNKNSSKSDELDELFRQSVALEQQKQPTPPPHETEYESSYSYEPEQTYEPEPTHESEPDTKTDDYNPIFDYDSIVVNETETAEEESSQYSEEFEAMEQMDESDVMEETDVMDEKTPAYTAPQNITPPPYIPPQNPSTTPPPTKKKEDALDGFDVEKFIKDNATNFTITIICKVISQILCVWLLLKWLLYAPTVWWIILIVGALAKGLINLIFSTIYEDYIEKASKSIKKVTTYNKVPRLSTTWGTLLDFPYGNLYTDNEDELIIMTDETKVTSHEFKVEHHKDKNDNETLITCEYYIADMEGRTSFANNIIITKSKMPFVKRLKFFQEISQYVLYYNEQQDLDECDLPRVLAIADKVSAYLGKRNFAMFFDSKNIHMVTPILNLDKFNYGTFNYTIADRVRNDITAIANRVCLSDLLAEN